MHKASSKSEEQNKRGEYKYIKYTSVTGNHK